MSAAGHHAELVKADSGHHDVEPVLWGDLDDYPLHPERHRISLLSAAVVVFLLLLMMFGNHNDDGIDPSYVFWLLVSAAAVIGVVVHDRILRHWRVRK